jgi:uracil-DNA glycosylase family 4
MDVNQYDVAKGYGKLVLEGEGKVLFLWQNPSTIRFSNCMNLALGGVGLKFMEFLKTNGLEENNISFTNVVKCSTPYNRPPKFDECKACSKWLGEEIKIIRPSVLISLGNIAKNSIDLLDVDCRKYSIWHPSYVSRNRTKEMKYVEQLKQIILEINQRGF